MSLLFRLLRAELKCIGNKDTDGKKEPVLPGVRLVPSVYFETNRLRTQRNLIADGSATLCFEVFTIHKPSARGGLS